MSENEAGRHAAVSLNLKGIRLTDKGDYEGAILAFTEALALEPDMAGLYFNRAEAERLHGDFDKARADLDEAMKRSPGEVDYQHARGLLAYDEDDYDTALAFYGKTLEMNPGYSPAWNDKGVIHFRKDDFRTARTCFEKAVTLDPEFSEAWFNLADTCDELGLPRERAKALAALEALGQRPEANEDRL